MKRINHFIIAASLLFSSIAQADMSPKTRAFLVVTGYSTAGGALLGLASMAFDGEPRNIAQGASLGLYAGILFASYIIYSHENSGGYQEDPNSPYDGAPKNQAPKGTSDGFFSTEMRYNILQDKHLELAAANKSSNLDFGMNFINYKF